ncbi:XK-related protein 8-like [Syngnathus typhle]|uniref:XK-related protein 8-like n=1 Tax=Syngnathus typhle TaxID=161592 RepID=UPI002A6A17C4|nr:XK-related protein 8-like [Syngnathus typhle]
MSFFKFSKFHCVLDYVSLALHLVDIGMDIWAVVSLYQEEEYVYLGVLIFVLLGSSVLVQAYSWLWYTYDDLKRMSTIEGCLSPRQLKVVHFFQLGVYFRHTGLVELTLTKNQDSDSAVYLTHDLSMLRLFEAFSESAPQVVLSLTIMLQRGHVDPWTVLKASISASTIACSVAMYHRALRSFLPEKEVQSIASSLIYFIWNLLLIFSRLAAIAFFASVLPCFIFTHFICSWIILFFCVWCSKPKFMDSPCGEFLYQATVGLILYFNWFNVVDEKTRFKTTLYHSFILLDTSLICGLWCWRIYTQPPFEISFTYACIMAVSVVALYIFGLILKILYYKCFHPNVTKKTQKEDATGPPEKAVMFSAGDAAENGFPHIGDRSAAIEDAVDGAVSRADVRLTNKRMRKLAGNFYS